MHVRIQLVAIEDDGTEHVQEIADLTRTEASMETLGLTLEESKQMLQTLQQAITERQVATYLAQHRACPHCSMQRRLKKSATAPFRTLRPRCCRQRPFKVGPSSGHALGCFLSQHRSMDATSCRT